MNQHTSIWLIPTLCLLLLSGCGGSSSSSSSGSSSVTATGVFTDSPVQGLRYVSGSLSGYTDSNGTFQYEKGQTVSFYVGDILIGQANGQAVLTPVNLVSGATDQTNPTVSNIAQFLQSLDDDGNPANGITITSQESTLAAGDTVNFNQSIANFANDGNMQTIVAALTAVTSGGSRNPVPSNTSQNNLQNTLLALLSGNWSGTYSGGDSGTWSVTIDTAGTITGTGNSSGYGGFSITGSVTSNGSANFTSGGASGPQVGAAYTGSFDSDAGTASGDWTSSNCCQGTWTGSKQ
jgi:hypothetical protein